MKVKPLAACASALAMAALFIACSNERRSPTEPAPRPAPEPTPRTTADWWGSWTVDEAYPPDHCLADSVNEEVGRGAWANMAMQMDVAVGAGSIGIVFHFGSDGFLPGHSSEGFFPVEFTGTVDERGVVRAAVAPSWIGSLRRDPYGDYCHAEWETVGGELTGSFSHDRNVFTGSVVESFRTDGDNVFAIRSHFEARRR